jgi:hypothetical protein
MAISAFDTKRAAADVWRFRAMVERDASFRFKRLAERLTSVGAPEKLVDLSRRSSADEARHAHLCAGLAEEYGASVDGLPPPRAPEVAPCDLGLRERVLYECVAACCITETESMGVLTTLVRTVRDAKRRRVLRELAEDEVRHARLGWAHLASERERGETAFLGPLVPAMLEGSVAPDLFAPGSPERDDERLVDHGVLPRSVQREVFTRTLEEVIFPGLASNGVDVAPARAWLEARRAAAA